MLTRRKSSRNSTCDLKQAINSVCFRKICSRESLELVVRSLQTKYHCDVKLSVTHDFELVGIFIQDDKMKQMFKTFPEIVIVETSIELSDLSFPIFLLTIEDGNGISEIVAVGVFELNDEATCKWFLETFQENNPSVTKTCVTVCNSNLVKREVLKDIFPDALHTLGLPHILKVFNENLMSLKLGINDSQRNGYVQAFENLCCASSITDYKEQYKVFKNTVPKKLKKYFKAKWHSNRSEWMLGLVFGSGSFLDKHHQRLKIFNLKMRSTALSFISLHEFVNKLFNLLQLTRNEEDKVALREIRMLLPKDYELDIVRRRYFQFLTPYAFKFILSHLSLSSKVDIVWNGSGYSIALENKLIVKGNGCNCTFFQSMNLPCKHIFALRQKLNRSQFDEKLCGQRWHRDYYLKSRKIFLQQKDITAPINQLMEVDDHLISTNDKFTNASIISARIASLVSQSSSDIEFERRIDFLESLFKNWSEGKRVKVQQQPDVPEVHSLLDDHVYEPKYNESRKKRSDEHESMDIGGTEDSNVSADDGNNVTADCNISNDDSNDDYNSAESNIVTQGCNISVGSTVSKKNSCTNKVQTADFANTVVMDTESNIPMYTVEVEIK